MALSQPGGGLLQAGAGLAQVDVFHLYAIHGHPPQSNLAHWPAPTKTAGPPSRKRSAKGNNRPGLS
ncbi:hypothetical protein FAK_03720 [Desulfoferula mesophila]|uniref:Uncharacterized protein n=1 Tax=Desulfoferula mesophila TaxID=3058419 RepID=A0AAU9E860_9BACT|nr:hypothetical protein FAK_03720 [Desulfoferula mesophilus]